MKTKFNFVNIAGGVYHDITNDVINTPYNTHSTMNGTSHLDKNTERRNI